MERKLDPFVSHKKGGKLIINTYIYILISTRTGSLYWKQLTFGERYFLWVTASCGLRITVISLLCHFSGCAWYALGTLDLEKTWVQVTWRGQFRRLECINDFTRMSKPSKLSVFEFLIFSPPIFRMRFGRVTVSAYYESSNFYYVTMYTV